MNIAVAQLGARRHYLVPAALSKSRMLAQLHTDLYVKNWPFGVLLSRFRSSKDLLHRLIERSDTELEPGSITAYPLFGLEYKLRTRTARSQSELTRTWIWGGRRFARLVADADLSSADAVYGYTSAAKELFEAAKAKGLYCILDHATAPKSYEDSLVNEEIRRYPRWTTGTIDDEWAEAYTARQKEEWQLADLIICGSTFVLKAISSLGGPVDNTSVLPLGFRNPCPKYPESHRRRNDPLHVLFVGNDAMRKGIGDFVEAIRRAGPHRFRARVVGEVKLTEYGRRRAGEVVELVGAVRRSEMPSQYRWADVFVLPSVSDTFGLVILEAMAHGVPVIATSHTGAPDVIRNGIDGFIVPPMAPATIAECLVRLGSDSKLLSAMSRNSFDRCRDFSGESYARALAALLQNRSQTVF